MNAKSWIVKGVPVYLMLVIYFPASFLGLFLLRDRSAVDFFIY